MKRTHKKSKIVFLHNDFINVHYPHDSEIFKAINGYILQVEEMNCIYVIEYLKPEDADEYINSSATETPAKNTLDMEYENALTTVLNNDPQGKYSGRTLEEIFNDPNGAQWVDWALKNMHNKFILDRVKIIYNKRGAK